MALSDISSQEYPELEVPSPESHMWNHFDTVRFAGFTSLGVKKSVKIMSKEHFADTEAFGDNILSCKDRRVYELGGEQGVSHPGLQQATRVGGELAILHDDWVYQGAETFCEHNQNITSAAFGVTADLIMTGIWTHGAARTGSMIKKRLVDHYTTISGRRISKECFSRHLHFGSWYKLWFDDNIKSMSSPQAPQSWRCKCVSDPQYLLNKAPTRIYQAAKRPSVVFRLPEETKALVGAMDRRGE